MNKEETKIITLGDIFRNLETEEQAFEFLKYIKNLQQENQKYKKVIDKVLEDIKEYKELNYSKYYENEIEIELIDKILKVLGDD